MRDVPVRIGPECAAFPIAGENNRSRQLSCSAVLRGAEQVNYLIAAGTALGLASVRVISGSGAELTGSITGLERRQAEPLPCLGVQEKSIRKGHRCLTIVTGLKRSRYRDFSPRRLFSMLNGKMDLKAVRVSCLAPPHHNPTGLALNCWKEARAKGLPAPPGTGRLAAARLQPLIESGRPAAASPNPDFA